jgi:diguanylate cyclase (GGDEF)-like protein/PAS domain S-box-containing protein
MNRTSSPPAPRPATAALASESGVPATSAAHVLLVTQDTSLLAAWRGGMAVPGVSLVPADSPEQALWLLAQAAFDLVIVDLNQPGAARFCQQLQQQPETQHLPLLTLSDDSHQLRPPTDEASDLTRFSVTDLTALQSRVNRLVQARSQVTRKTPRRAPAAAPATAAPGVPLEVYQYASAAITEGIMIADARADGWPIRYVNQAFERITGFTAAEVLGREFLFLAGPDTDPGAAAQLRRALAEGKPARATWECHRKDRSVFWNEMSVSPVNNAGGGLTHFVAVQNDVTARRQAEERLQYLVDHDSLTRLCTRARFTTELEEFLVRHREQPRGALLYFDLDNFKMINDSLGHLAGDMVLTQFAGILRDHLRRSDLAARFGGDEFMVLLREAHLADAVEVADRIRRAFSRVRGTGGDAAERYCDLCLSVGVAAFDGSQDSEQLLSQADLACCAAKKSGRDRVEVYQPGHTQITQLRDNARWSHRLREAIRNEEFELWFQPVFSLPARKLQYYEGLVRLSDADGNTISPGAFLPVAERFHLAGAIDRVVIRKALAWLAREPGLQLAINLSGQSFDDPDLAAFIEQTFQQAGIAPARAAFEITETSLLSNLRQTCEVMGRLKQSGFRFALDDFGSGFSSLAYLRDLPIDCVKIDGTFVRDLRKEPINEILVRTMKETARLLGMTTVAEFVADAATVELLAYIGVDYAQGNFLGAATRMPAPPRS